MTLISSLFEFGKQPLEPVDGDWDASAVPEVSSPGPSAPRHAPFSTPLSRSAFVTPEGVGNIRLPSFFNFHGSRSLLT